MLNDFEYYLEQAGKLVDKDYFPIELDGKIIGARNLHIYRGDLEDLLNALADSDLPHYDYFMVEQTLDPEGEAEMDYLKVDLLIKPLGGKNEHHSS